MLCMTIGKLNYLTGCYQHKTCSAPSSLEPRLKEWSTHDLEALRMSCPPLQPDPSQSSTKCLLFQSSQMCDGNKGLGAKTQGEGNHNGTKEKTQLPRWITPRWSSWRSLRTESHWRDVNSPSVTPGGGGGRQAGLCGRCPPGGFEGSVSSGHRAVNAEVNRCPGSPPSCHSPWLPNSRPCRCGFAPLWSGPRSARTKEPGGCREARLKDGKNGVHDKDKQSRSETQTGRSAWERGN